MKLNLNKKGQGLPLNTIVLAILVIIVLLVIIVFFTSSVGKSGQTLNNQSATACSKSNPVLATLGATHVVVLTSGSCGATGAKYSPPSLPSGTSSSDYTSVPGIPNCCYTTK